MTSLTNVQYVGKKHILVYLHKSAEIREIGLNFAGLRPVSLCHSPMSVVHLPHDLFFVSSGNYHTVLFLPNLK